MPLDYKHGSDDAWRRPALWLALTLAIPGIVYEGPNLIAFLVDWSHRGSPEFISAYSSVSSLIAGACRFVICIWLAVSTMSALKTGRLKMVSYSCLALALIGAAGFVVWSQGAWPMLTASVQLQVRMTVAIRWLAVGIGDTLGPMIGFVAFRRLQLTE